MKDSSLELGDSPQLHIDECHGDLELRGSSSGATTVESDGRKFEVTQHENTAHVEALDGNCVIRIPEGGSVKIGMVGGQLRMKGVLGSVEIETVGGDCVGRRMGAISIGNIGGDCQLKGSSGSLTLGSVGGDAKMQNIGGPVQIEVVGGDVLAHGVPYGLEVDQTSGDIDFRSEIGASTTYRLVANGDVNVRLPQDANITFKLSGAQVRVDPPIQRMGNGDEVLATLGNVELGDVSLDEAPAGEGGATMEIDTHGDVRVRVEDDCATEDEFEVSFSADIDNYMVDVSAKLDSHMRKLESQLEDLPDMVRRRVERKLDAARRHVNAAEKHARRAAENAERAHHKFGWAGPAGSPAPTQEPISEGERMAILKMLEEGQINVAEAQKLLAALEG